MVHDVVITGIGLVTSLAEGADSHCALFNGNVRPVYDRQSNARFPAHPLVQVDYDKFIPKKSDQRQMDPGQRLGVYAAGVALQDGGVLGDAEILPKIHLIVAAGNGERDTAVDESILTAIRGADDRQAFFNQQMSKNLRPTLFLAQLPNLLAGNISIVLGVTGSSRTFVGGESAGLDAIATMAARIRAGNADIGLAGGASSAMRMDYTLLAGLGGTLLSGEPAGVWSRGARGGGMIHGSAGAFLLLESRGHAEARGARISAVLGPVLSEHCHRETGAVEATASKLWAEMEGSMIHGPVGILSGATGVEPVTAQELASFDQIRARREIYIRATGTLIGHSSEASAPVNAALAALALRQNAYFPPFEHCSAEQTAASPPLQIVVTSFGHWRGEGMMLLRRDDGVRT